jgi:hypothetical protein
MGEKYIRSSRAHRHVVITLAGQELHLQQGGIKPYSARLTRQEKNKMTPRICMVYLVELIG